MKHTILKNVIWLIAFLMIICSSSVSPQLTTTYSDTIPTSYPNYDATCTGPNSIMPPQRQIEMHHL